MQTPPPGIRRAEDYRSAEDRLPKVVSFGIAKWENTWHVFAMKTQGDRVIEKKLIFTELPSEAQAYDQLRLQADFHFMCHRDVFS